MRRMSESLFVVSSNPGVSMRVTDRPSSSKAWAIWTTLVQDWRPLPILRFDPLARLMNYQELTSAPFRCFQTVLTVVLPLPVAPMTLMVHILLLSKWFCNRMVANSRDGDIVRIDDERPLFKFKSDFRSGELHRKAHLSGCWGWFSPWSKDCSRDEISLAIYMTLTRLRTLRFQVIDGCKSVWIDLDEARSRFRCIAWW